MLGMPEPPPTLRAQLSPGCCVLRAGDACAAPLPQLGRAMRSSLTPLAPLTHQSSLTELLGESTFGQEPPLSEINALSSAKGTGLA